jgi:hypothetical protein
MPIQYSGKISKDDFRKSIFLHNPQLKLQRWLTAVLLAIMLISVGFLMTGNSNSALANSLPGLLPALLVVMLLGAFPWWLPYVQLAAYDKKENIYRNNVFGTIDDHELSVNSAEIKASFKWDVFVDYKFSSNLLLLYQSKACFNLFKPGMFSSQAEWEQFVALVHEKTTQNKKHPRV